MYNYCVGVPKNLVSPTPLLRPLFTSYSYNLHPVNNIMEMSFEHRIAASREQVWKALNDIEILKASIPGCDNLISEEENTFKAQITAKVGPVKAKFKFDVTLTDIDPPNAYTINGQGQGGAAGFANGSAAVTLREDGKHTILAYHAKANVGGKLAQLGARLIDGAAQKMANEFFVKFSELAANPSLLDAAPAPEAKPILPTWLWLGALITLTAMGFLLLR